MARGYDTKDGKLFSLKEVEKLKQCLKDSVYLIYRVINPFTASHYRCPARQMLMLTRAICSDVSLETKREKELSVSYMKDKTLYIDGFNITI